MEDWIGSKMDMRYVSRKTLLAKTRKHISSSTLPQACITTDVVHPWGVPGFVLELENDVYEEGYTEIMR
jgi:hypothetical protein